jgi:hypothetical protein
MEGAKRVRLTIDLVSVEVYSVPATPIVPPRPFFEHARLRWLTRVGGVIVKLPPVDSEIIVQTFLTFGDAPPRWTVVRKPDAVFSLLTLIGTLVQTHVVEHLDVATRAVTFTFDVKTRDLFVIKLIPIPVVSRGER